MSAWLLAAGGAVLAIAVVLLRWPVDDTARVSPEWIAEQRRRRGLVGFEGAYRDED